MPLLKISHPLLASTSLTILFHSMLDVSEAAFCCCFVVFMLAVSFRGKPSFYYLKSMILLCCQLSKSLLDDLVLNQTILWNIWGHHGVFLFFYSFTSLIESFLQACAKWWVHDCKNLRLILTSSRTSKSGITFFQTHWILNLNAPMPLGH